MSKISMFVKLTAAEGKRDDIVAALEKMLPSVEEEAGTERYVICTDAADANVVWMYEQYVDNDALGVHGSSPALGTLFADLGEALGAPPEMSMANPVSGKGV